ncbi:hypothetical protein [Kitasatospora aureofaciens]|uniref:hypothetical protein n=1 Tax=Kitasatospora aureofaciens TaxID=1894 RepID=UPI00131AB137|nr:hypothetical protein [Kitasatospora aureofaciens]
MPTLPSTAIPSARPSSVPDSSRAEAVPARSVGAAAITTSLTCDISPTPPLA